MKTFKQLGINDALLRSIEKEGFEQPTPIQEKSIPHILQGKDVIAGAATGSGKTLAFATGIVKLNHDRNIKALVLTPTRELATQVSDALKIFSRFKQLNIVAIYGGVSLNPQIDKLETADVVVGTPGRVLDHMRRNTLKLRHIQVLVLDEADRMLDMGFIDDVETIIRACPGNRQTLLFSATITDQVAHISKKYMRNQVEISADPFVDPTKLRQIYYDVPSNLKLSLLVYLLKNEKAELSMVFCNTRRNVDFIVKNLKAAGIKATAIHGGFSQSKRTHTINSFHDQRVPVLVCTDVAARGLDIQGVTHVYNYDVPKESKQYIHRIGRTARAGERGLAITLLAQRDHDNFSRVLRDFAVEVKKWQLPKLKKIRPKFTERKNFRTSGSRYGQKNKYGSYRGRYSRDRRENRPDFE